LHECVEFHAGTIRGESGVGFDENEEVPDKYWDGKKNNGCEELK
jgi:hypothetical protein